MISSYFKKIRSIPVKVVPGDVVESQLGINQLECGDRSVHFEHGTKKVIFSNIEAFAKHPTSSDRQLLQKQSLVLSELKQSVLNCDVLRMQRCWQEAKVIIPEKLCTSVTSSLEPLVTQCRETISSLLTNLHSKDYEKLCLLNDELGAKSLRSFAICKNESFSRSFSRNARPSRQGLGYVFYELDVVFRLANDNLITLAQIIEETVRVYGEKRTNTEAVERCIEDATERVLHLADKYKDCQTPLQSQSRNSITDSEHRQRLLMLDEFYDFLFTVCNTLSDVIKPLCDSAKRLERCRRKHLVKLMQIQGERCNREQESQSVTERDADCVVLKQATVLQTLCHQFAQVTRAEKKLTLFAFSSAAPADPHEIDKTVKNLESGLSDLKEFEKNLTVNQSYTDPTQNFKSVSIFCQCITNMFPDSNKVVLKQMAFLRLAELRLSKVDLAEKWNTERYAVRKALLSKNEHEITRALKCSLLPSHDPAIVSAEKELKGIQKIKADCLFNLRIAAKNSAIASLEAGLKQAENLFVAPSHPTLILARMALTEATFVALRQNNVKRDLQEAVNSKNTLAVRSLTAQAKVCGIADSESTVSKALSFLADQKVLENNSYLEKKIKVQQAVQALNDCSIEVAQAEVHKSTSTEFQLAKLSTNEQHSSWLELTSVLKFECAKITENSSAVGDERVIREVLNCLTEVNTTYVSHLIDKAVDVLAEVDERKAKARSLSSTLQTAIITNTENAFKYASTATEQEFENLRYLSDSECDELLELHAKVAHKLGLIREKSKHSEDMERLQAIAAARHQLKKALFAQESDAKTLRDALNTFRSLCFPNETDYLESTRKKKDKSTVSMEKINAVGKEEKGHNSSCHNADVKSDLQEDDPENITHTATNESMQAHVSAQTDEARNQKEETVNKSGDREYDEDHEESRQEVMDIRERRRSADQSAVVGAWKMTDEKNLLLLRKAERNLHKIEMKEKVRKQMERNEQEWEKLKEEMCEKLENTVEHGDRVQLWKSLNEFERYFGDDNLNVNQREIVHSARDALCIQTAAQHQLNLAKAIRNRNEETLSHVIYQIENETETHLPQSDQEKEKLQADLKQGKLIIDQLKHLQRCRSAVLRIPRNALSEIRLLKWPHDCIQKTMTGTFLLLGEQEKYVKEWSHMQCLLCKLGKLSVHRRIALAEASEIRVSTARKVLILLCDFSSEQVHAACKPVGIIYSWTKAMASEALAQAGSASFQRTPAISTQVRKTVDMAFWQRLARPSSVPEHRRSAIHQHPRRSRSAVPQQLRCASADTV